LGTILCASDNLYDLYELSSSVRSLGYDVAAAGSYDQAIALSKIEDLRAIVFFQSRAWSELESPSRLKSARPDLPILLLVPACLTGKGIPPGVDLANVWDRDGLSLALTCLLGLGVGSATICGT
jgi:hypothetical protein